MSTNSGDPPDETGPMEDLLKALRTTARTEAAEIARLEADVDGTLSAEMKARIVDRILTARSGGATAAMPADDLGRRRQARALSRRTSFAAIGGVAVAAAAALFLWARPPAESPLPVYGISTSGGVAEVRGGGDGAALGDGHFSSTADPVRVRADSTLRILCRPAEAAGDAIAARAFAVENEKTREITASVRTAPTGAVELQLSGADLFAAFSHGGQVRVAIGRPHAITVLEGAAALAGTDGPTARWLTVPIGLDGR